MTAPETKQTNWFHWQGGNLILHVVVQPRATGSPAATAII